MRTFHKNSIVMSVELLSRGGSGSDFDFGSIKLWVVDGYPVVQFIPAATEDHTKQNLTVDRMVSDGQLHDIQVTLNNSEVKLQVDGSTTHSRRYYAVLESRGTVILGYSLDQIDRQHGFVGCMQGIKIQGQRLDAIAVMESDDAVGLLLDGCQLVDHCSENNICEHGSVCLSDWDGIHCLCENNHYEGKACHFAKYAKNCEEYYRMGYRTSGIYLIDVDGVGPLNHAYVQCEMGGHLESGRSRRRAVQGGVTRLEHNFELNTTVRAPWLPDVQYLLNYRGMSRAHLAQLTRISSHCEQYLEYGCQNAPLQLSNRTWFKSTTGEIVDYIGSHISGSCSCPPDTACDGEHCYCDLNRDGYLYDKGYNRERKQLPIMEMTFIQTQRAGIAHMTLGPLRCWGSSAQSADRSVTFTQAGIFLQLRPWLTGDLRLNFKTHGINYLLLYQGAEKSGGQEKDVFYVIINSAYSIRVHFSRGTHLVSRDVQTPTRLSEGNWHSLVLEWDLYNLRISLDSTRIMMDLPDGFWSRESDEEEGQEESTSLYLGSLPYTLHTRDLGLDGIQGFTGCMYGLVYNGSPVDLPSLVGSSVSEITKGCMSYCWPNPCQNGGVCQENWVSYTCRCSNPWAHMGNNCEIDITKDAVTFSGLPGASLQFDLTYKQPKALSATVVIGFRTFQTEALLLYMHDHLSNFVQLELADAHTIIVTFNDERRIIREAVRTDDVLNDGEWKQVVAENYYNFTRLMVEGHSKVIEVRRGRLKTYTLNPFINSDQQTVFISRPAAPSIHAYVGGVKGGASTTSALVGCIRGVRVGNFVFTLQDAATSQVNETLVAPVCDKGCREMACHNNGICHEKWRDGQFQCDCDKSGFSGRRCEIEPSVLVEGSTVVRHTFQLPLTERFSSSERLSFRFKAQPRKPEAANKHVVLIYIASSKNKDFVMIKFLESGKIRLETNQGSTTFRMDVEGQFEDGQPHDFSYIREGSKMNVKVSRLDQFGNAVSILM
ncbi:contactin-associated protein-like 5 [Elysia marginata]|uniref:Contactin-associated protein-like 5 n=1 Tax=Elysia marginata TaxID=1093978 RepID=A0AAV4GII7_9GAST|nr:contactin-associated protein-like 5 [Elysia marginata]